MNAIQGVWFAMVGIAWPALIVGAMLIWPGPTAPQAYVPERAGPFSSVVAPPVDTTGSISIYSHNEEQGSTAVFWEVPEEGMVRVTIEIDPIDDSAESDVDQSDNDVAADPAK